MSAIFVSYRRADTRAFTGRVRDTIEAELGRPVFLDTDTLRAGSRTWPDQLEDALVTCAAFVVVVGPQWVSLERDGRRRLDHDDDWVALEIATALELRKPIFVVLEDETPPLDRALLPERVVELADHQAIRVRNDHFRRDVVDLVEGLRATGRTLTGSAKLQGWAEQAAAMMREGLHREARLCWTRALWEASPSDIAVLTERWAEAEASQSADPMWRDVARSLRDGAVSERLWEVATARADAERLGPRARAIVDLGAGRPTAMSRRALIGAGAASMLVPDPVALPGAIRHAGQHVDYRQTHLMSADLERLFPGLVHLFESSCESLTIVRRAAHPETGRIGDQPITEETRQATLGYLHLLWSSAHARLSEPELALGHLEKGLDLAEQDDPIQKAAVLAFRLRIQQALQGRSSTEPVSLELRYALDALPRFERYKAERLISGVRLLGPDGALLNPFANFVAENRRWDGLSELGDADLANRDRIIASVARDNGPDSAAELIYWLRGQSRAIAVRGTRTVLEEFPEEPGALAAAAISACHLDDPDLGVRVLEAAHRLSADDCLVVLAGTSGYLRRLGLTDEGLRAYEHASRADQSELEAEVRLARAGAAFGLDVPEPTVARVIEDVGEGRRFHHGVDLAEAVSWFGPTQGRDFVARLSGAVDQVHDRYSTVTHYSVSTLWMASALLGSFATEHLALSAIGRRQAALDDRQLLRGPRFLR